MDSENRTDDRRGGTVKERLLDNDNDLVEPLLLHHVDNGDCGDAEHRDCENHGHYGDDGNVVHDATADVGDEDVSDQTRRIASVAIFWAGAAVSCCVSSIDIVWDILGGSLSLVMGFLIPAGSYIVLAKKLQREETASITGMENDGIGGREEEESTGSLEQRKEDFATSKLQTRGASAEEDKNQREGESSCSNLSATSQTISTTDTEASSHNNPADTAGGLIPQRAPQPRLGGEDAPRRQQQQQQETGTTDSSSQHEDKQESSATFLTVLFIPMMFILTGNAIYNLSHGDD